MKKTVLMTLLMSASVAYADGAPPEVKPLQCLVGAWKGSASMTMGAQKVDGVKISIDCKPTSAQWGVACAATFTGIPGVDKYEETDLFGYDPGSNRLHWFAVTNGGETHDHVAEAGGNRWVYTGTQDKKPLKEVIDMSCKDRAMEFTAESFVDGKSASVMKGTLKR